MLVFVLNQAQKANTGKIQTPVYENVREFGVLACRKNRLKGRIGIFIGFDVPFWQSLREVPRCVCRR